MLVILTSEVRRQDYQDDSCSAGVFLFLIPEETDLPLVVTVSPRDSIVHAEDANQSVALASLAQRIECQPTD